MIHKTQIQKYILSRSFLHSSEKLKIANFAKLWTNLCVLENNPAQHN